MTPKFRLLACPVLASKRFDCFPRRNMEIWNEQALNADSL